MIKALLGLFGLSILTVSVSFAQLNVSFVSQLSYDVDANDIWGWADPDDGTEYALVGLRDGVSIVSLADPANPQEVSKIPGQPSTWRDLKTWGNFAYVTTDQPGTSDGLLVIDLSTLPDSVTYENITEFPGLGSLLTCHNLYIDENGICYVAGCEQNNGGVLFFDVATDPGNPIYLGAGAPIYAHDVYTRDNRMYASEIYDGNISIYDVSDPTDVQLLGNRPTDFTFTHNAWLSDDGNTVFTTDERANAPVGAYDVSDPTDILELDQFRPSATVGTGVIPHNVHVLDDYLVISHYTDGLVIADASRPDNLIEVGLFDTWTGPDGGFNGAWGAYPFLPSGLVLISDIQSGLFVLDPQYVRGCYLEGGVTDSETGAPLNAVEVVLEATQENEAISGLNGQYRTGLEAPGTYTVTFSTPGYEPFSTEVVLERGEVKMLDVSLQPLERVTVQGNVVRAENGAGIVGAKVLLFDEELGYEFVTTAGPNGSFQLDDVFVGTYSLVAGAWGHSQILFENVSVAGGNAPLNLELEDGYEDDFILDLGWQTENQAVSGAWERAIPIGTLFENGFSNPGTDAEGDIGSFCYLTGNGAGSAGAFDVDNGTVELRSPPMDLSTYEDPILEFQAWFFNAGGSGIPDDTLWVEATNGQQTALLLTITEPGSNWRSFQDIHLADFLPLTEEMRIQSRTADLATSGHIVEAGVDVFRVSDGVEVTSTNPGEPELLTFQAAPNPFRQQLWVRYNAPGLNEDGLHLRLISSLGQVVKIVPLADVQGNVPLAVAELPTGWYVLGLYQRERPLSQVKIIKGR